MLRYFANLQPKVRRQRFHFLCKFFSGRQINKPTSASRGDTVFEGNIVCHFVHEHVEHDRVVCNIVSNWSEFLRSLQELYESCYRF